MKKLFIPLLILVLFQACDKDDPSPDNNEHVNTWIYDNMKYWYYWTDEIPASRDKSRNPEDFFKSLLSGQDRFSWIQPNFAELINSLRGVNKEDGFEFALVQESGSSNVTMFVLYVKPNSPASAAGLQRGYSVSKINEQQITVDNYLDLIDDLSENHTLTFRPNNLETAIIYPEETRNITPIEYAENPNHINKVITVGDYKIGYYVYNLFAEGPDENSKAYSDEMDNIFASFKSQGITDLIIDLRFNSGGAESASQKLASLIAPGVTSATVFVEHEYNEGVTNDVINDPNLGEGFLKVPFLVKPQNVGSQLNNNRVYILTGSRTASASELIINGLKPFMDVVVIGETTVGKNVGSISIYDEADPNNTWGMQPIVVKLLNSEGQSEYAGGFAPQVLVRENFLQMYPLGDNREVVLNAALAQITGTPGPARTVEPEKAAELLFHSLDAKKRSGIVTVDIPF